MGKFSISCGSLAKPFQEQLKEQGLRVSDKKALGHLQLDADAVVRLAVRGLLPHSATTIVRRKIVDRVARLVDGSND